jgi:hypothetical protein
MTLPSLAGIVPAAVPALARTTARCAGDSTAKKAELIFRSTILILGKPLGLVAGFLVVSAFEQRGSHP